MTKTITIGLVVLFGLALVILLPDLLLLAFAAVLVAAILDAAISLIMKVLPFGRLPALILSLLIALLLAVAGGVYGGVTLASQTGALSEALADAWDVVASELENLGVPAPQNFELGDLVDSLPEPQTMFGGAGAVLGTGLGLISNFVIVVLTGIFLAADPGRYRDGLVLLAPREVRERLRTVLDRVGKTLQRWMVGQLALMAIVGSLTMALLLALGIGYAIPLGLIAGLLNFIPFVGPILAFVPIGLAMLGQDMTLALVVLGGYTLIQQLDANVFTPLIQDRVVHLAPALTVVFLLFMGMVSGPIGVALATPLLAALRVLVLDLYVSETLEDPAHASEHAEDSRETLPGTVKR